MRGAFANLSSSDYWQHQSSCRISSVVIDELAASIHHRGETFLQRCLNKAT